MKKFILLLPLLFLLSACAAQPPATPDLSAYVNATLTAVAQASAPTQQPAATQPAAPAEQPTTPPTAEPIAALPLDLLRNAAYTSADWGEFMLTDGIYYRPTPTGQESPEAYTTRMLDTVLYGDLNADGAQDALVFLATQNGGTGHFIEMAAMLNSNGGASNAATIYLGDRVAIESGAIEGGVITLNMRVQGPNDGMCCPSQLVTWTFRLENGQLIKIS